MDDAGLDEVLDEVFGRVVTDGVEGFEEHAASSGEANTKATAVTTVRPAVFMGDRAGGHAESPRHGTRSRNHAFPPKIGMQHFGEDDGAVGLTPVLHHRCPYPRPGQGRAVQGMDERR